MLLCPIAVADVAAETSATLCRRLGRCSITGEVKEVVLVMRATQVHMSYKYGGACHAKPPSRAKDGETHLFKVWPNYT